MCHYTDDTIFYACVLDLEKLVERLENDLILAIEWFEINYVKLTLKGLGVNLIPPVVFPSRLEDMKIFSININYFNRFFRFFDISMLQTNDIIYNTWRQHFFYLQPNLNRLFNDFLNLYWYWISSSRKIKRGSNWPPPPHQKKTAFKKPALLGLNQEICHFLLPRYKHVIIRANIEKSKIREKEKTKAATNNRWQKSAWR